MTSWVHLRYWIKSAFAIFKQLLQASIPSRATIGPPTNRHLRMVVRWRADSGPIVRADWIFYKVYFVLLSGIWQLKNYKFYSSVTKPRGVWRKFLVPPAAKSSTRSIASELQSIVSILFSSRFQRHIAYSKGKSEFFTTVLMDLSPD